MKNHNASRSPEKNDSPNNKLRFTHFNVPHIHTLKRTHSEIDYRMTIHSNNMYKSLEMSSSVARLDKPNNSNNCLNSMCLEENVKMNKIITSQVDNKFLLDSKLPKIAFLLNQPRTIVNNNKVVNNKIFGERYNPYCFSNNASKHSSERNPYGALFNN